MQVRTSARKRALQVLFQLDVARQRVDEVLEAELQKIRTRVLAPVFRHASEGCDQIRAALADQHVSGANRAGRLVRTVGQAAELELRACADRLEADVESVTGIQAPEHALDGEEAANRRVSAAEAAIRRAVGRLDHDPDLAERLTQITQSHLQRMARAVAQSVGPAQDVARFMVDLVRGTLKHRGEIDRRLSEISQSWDLARQPVVDRNILRLAAYEIMFRLDAPPPVVIDQAVNLAKRYGSAESGRFVNGVLGALARDTGRAAGDGRAISMSRRE